MTHEDDLGLLQAYEPVVRYNEGELFFPTAVEGYLAECDLLQGTSEQDSVVVVPKGEVTTAVLGSYIAPPGKSLYLRLVQDPLNGVELTRWQRRPDRPQVPCAGAARSRRAFRAARGRRLRGLAAAAWHGPRRHDGGGSDQVRSGASDRPASHLLRTGWSGGTAGSCSTTSTSTS